MGMHALRLDDDLWTAAMAKAKAEGRTLTGVLSDYLREYTATPQRTKTKAGGCRHTYPDVRNVAGVTVCRICG